MTWLAYCEAAALLAFPAAPPPRGPPQQLSAVRGHPWYDPYWVRRARVLVNGVELAGVLLADGPGRRAVQYDYQADGKIRVVRGPGGDHELATRELTGDVVVLAKAEE